MHAESQLGCAPYMQCGNTNKNKLAVCTLLWQEWNNKENEQKQALKYEDNEANIFERMEDTFSSNTKRSGQYFEEFNPQVHVDVF